MTTDQERAALVPCPLCGGDKGYRLDEGSTHRWWSIKCAVCGQEVSEARAEYPAETTPRTERADEMWNEAGEHAQGLRDQIARQASELAEAQAYIANVESTAAAMASELEALRGELQIIRAVSSEYDEFIRFHSAGNGDFDDFISKKLAAKEQQA